MGQYDLFRKIALSNLNQKEREVKTIKDNIISDFKSSPSYVQGYINNDTVYLRDFHVITDRLKNTKKLLSYPNESFNVGDVINIVDLNTKFLVIDLDEDRQIQTKGTIQSCNNTLKFYAPNESTNLWESKEIPCIIGNITLNTDETKYMPTVDNSLKLIVSNNEVTRQIKLNQVYKIGMYNYKISSVPDDISIPGLLQFRLEYSETEQPLPSYSLEILNGNSIYIQQGDSIQLNIQVKDGTTVLTTPPTYLFTSSDESILTVNELGVVTSLSVGNAIVACMLSSDNSVFNTIEITVEEIPVVDNYIASISGSNSIKTNQSTEYIATIYNNGIEVTDANCIWSLSNSYATITSQNPTNCIVKAGSTSGKTVTLRATKSDNTSIFTEIIITITGLW